VKTAALAADGGYDAEANHCQDPIRTTIPPTHGKREGEAPAELFLS